MKLAEKIQAIKTKVRTIAPDAKGHNYTYASPSKVLGIFNPLFEEFKILITPTIVDVKIEKFDTERGTDSPDGTFRKVGSDIVHNVQMIMMIEDLESDEIRSVPWAGVGSNGSEQGFGSALTYGERYFLLKYFGVAVDEDDPNHLQAKRESKKTIALKKLTPREVKNMESAIQKGNIAVVKTLLSKYEDSPEKDKLLKKLK